MESIGVRPSYDFLTMNLHFLKGRKLLITAGVYESEVAEKVQDTFEKYRETQSYKEAILYRKYSSTFQSLRHLVPAISERRVLPEYSR